MAYNINLTDGTLLVTIPNNTYVPAGTQGGVLDLTLYGKGKLDYGQSWNENFVHLLENFAEATEPDFPLDGMIWFDKGNTLLKYWNDTGLTWETLVTSGAGASTFVNVIGDTMTGNLEFPIPDDADPDEDSPGIIFTAAGSTDEARFYVEHLNPETSTLVIQVADNTGDDSISIRHKPTVGSGEEIVEILNLSRPTLGGPGIMSMSFDDGSSPPGGGDSIVFNEGGGVIAVGPDIRFIGAGLITADSNITMVIDDDNNGTGSEFQIAVHGRTSGTLDKCANFNETGGFFCALRAPSQSGNADWYLGTGGAITGINFGSTNSTIQSLRAYNSVTGYMRVEGKNGANSQDFVTKNQLDTVESGAAGAAIDREISGYTNWTTNGQLVTWNHNMSATLYSVMVTMNCTVSDAGYSPGNTIMLNVQTFNDNTQGDVARGGMAVHFPSSNQLQMRTVNDGIWYPHKSTGALIRLTPGRWRFRFLALA